MHRNRVPHPAPTLAALLVPLLSLAAGLRAATPAVPFGSHALSYASSIYPSAGQAAVEAATKTYYDNWKAAYYLSGCGAGQGRINYGNAADGDVNWTVSEAHGYGMLIFALMAGYDPNAKTYFDAMYQFYKAHPATGANRLLAWQQNDTCADVNGPDTASDGDLDVAQALLLADRQWGSCGAINYKSEAVAMINQLKAQDLDSSARYVKLGNWATSGNYLNSTRSSDFMPDHYRSFQWATGDTAWNGLINHTYFIVTSTANAATGLLPDFISSPLVNPVPAPANFLESADDGHYNWNACRDPWRLGTDYLVSGDARAKAAVQAMATWLKGAPVSGNPARVRAGYQLNGTQLVSYGDRAFTVPFAVAAMVDSGNQTLLNSFWANADVSGTGTVNYFGDSIKMLCMIVLSGNWWAPELLPDPCNTGSPSPTPSRTPTRTQTRTATASRTPSPTPSQTAPASSATPSPSPTPTYSRSSTPSVTASPTGTGSPTGSPTLSKSPSATPTATVTETASPTPSRSATASSTASPTPAPTGSTETMSPTASPSASPTPSSSPSTTASATPSASATASPTGTWSVTESPTLSKSPSATQTPAASLTASASATDAATLAASPSATASPTETGSVTESPTLSKSPSATQTVGVVETASPSPTVAVTASPSPPTATEASGALVIEALQAYPQPDPRQLRLRLQGHADAVRVRIYSPAWILLASLDSGAAEAGWSPVDLEPLRASLPHGLAFAQVQAWRGGVHSKAVTVRLVRLH